MALGDGPDPSMRGIVRTVEATYVEENEPADLEIPGQGRYQTRDGRVRIYKRGNLVRREHLDGRLLAIEGVEYLWVWKGDEEVPTAFPRDSAFWGWPDSPLTQRRGMDEWRDDDFTRPTGPPTETRFLGRDAWQVELGPPSHKPFPLTLIIDAATGLVLHQRNNGFRSVWSGRSWSSTLRCLTSSSRGRGSLDHHRTMTPTTRPTWLAAASG